MLLNPRVENKNSVGVLVNTSHFGDCLTAEFIIVNRDAEGVHPKSFWLYIVIVGLQRLSRAEELLTKVIASWSRIKMVN